MWSRVTRAICVPFVVVVVMVYLPCVPRLRAGCIQTSYTRSVYVSSNRLTRTRRIMFWRMGMRFLLDLSVDDRSLFAVAHLPALDLSTLDK